MLELFAMELAKGAISGAGSWGTKKVLDTIFTCNEPQCKTRCDCRIGNVDFNDLQCRNCHKHLRQFTNVCTFTVKQTGKIAHIGAEFYDWRWGFGKHGSIVVPASYLFVGLNGTQIVERNLFKNHDTGHQYSHDNYIWKPNRDVYWGNSPRMNANAKDVDNVGKDVLTHIELRFESRQNDLLFSDRYMINL
jgi:hypothetical protein